MMQMGDCSGVRVGEITERTHLSRPAVSHHLQILKDAGILKVRKEATKNFYYFDPDIKISGPIIRPDEGIDSKLKSCGLTDADIAAVYLSHMDFDHTSGLRLVKNAGGFYASEEEQADAKRLKLRYVDTWSGIVRIASFHYEQTGIGPAGRSYDVFRDGSVVLVSTPGHSHGHFSVKITGGNRYMVLADDAAYLQESFERKIIPGFTVDEEQAEKSLEWLIQCRKDPDCIEVLANHDPAVKEHTVTL